MKYLGIDLKKKKLYSLEGLIFSKVLPKLESTNSMNPHLEPYSNLFCLFLTLKPQPVLLRIYSCFWLKVSLGSGSGDS